MYCYQVYLCTALTACGAAYVNGQGVEASNVRGVAMISVAAALGSEHACGILGQANAEGRYGYDKNPQEATRLYREMKTCDCAATPTRRLASRRRLGCASIRRNARSFFALWPSLVSCLSVDGVPLEIS